MVRSLGERLGELRSHPEIVKCALTLDDSNRHNLPPDHTKTTDTRRSAFVAKWGDVSVELDALPLDVLRARIVREVESRMDLDAFAQVRDRESNERHTLTDTLASIV